LVANFDFLRALLQYSNFDEFHLFCPSGSMVKMLSEAIQREIPDEAIQSRIQLFHHLQLPEALGSHDYSVFHVGGWYFYYLRLAYLRARYARSPFSLTGIIHSLNTPDIQGKMRDLIESPFCPGDAIVCTSEGGRGVMERYMANTGGALEQRYGVRPEFPGQFPVIPLAVSEDWLSVGDDGTQRRAMGFSPETVVLLYVGRLSIDSKGDLCPLLYAMRGVIDSASLPVHLVLAGGANATNRKLLETTAQELGIASQVTVLSNITDDEKRRLYAVADVFVSPIDNLQETFGISIVEAMAASLPVVASAFNGYRELVVDGETGFAIPTLWGQPPAALTAMGAMIEPSVSQLLLSQNVAVDVGALQQRLGELVSNPALRARMGERGRQRARSRYIWPVVIGQYEAMWNGLEAGLPEDVSTLNCLDPNESDPYAIFHHYPTDHLGPERRLALTEMGRRCVTGQLPMPSMYSQMSVLHSSEMLRFLVERVAPGPVTWAQVEAELQAQDASVDIARFTLLWLIKVGVLEAR